MRHVYGEENLNAPCIQGEDHGALRAEETQWSIYKREGLTDKSPLKRTERG